MDERMASNSNEAELAKKLRNISPFTKALVIMSIAFLLMLAIILVKESILDSAASGIPVKVVAIGPCQGDSNQRDQTVHVRANEWPSEDMTRKYPCGSFYVGETALAVIHVNANRPFLSQLRPQTARGKLVLGLRSAHYVLLAIILLPILARGVRMIFFKSGKSTAK